MNLGKINIFTVFIPQQSISFNLVVFVVVLLYLIERFLFYFSFLNFGSEHFVLYLLFFAAVIKKNFFPTKFSNHLLSVYSKYWFLHINFVTNDLLNSPLVSSSFEYTFVFSKYIIMPLFCFRTERMCDRARIQIYISWLQVLCHFYSAANCIWEYMDLLACAWYGLGNIDPGPLPKNIFSSVLPVVKPKMFQP